MSDYDDDDDYGYDDYDDYDGGYDDGGYDDGGYDYGDYDHGGYEDHGAHDHESHDAGEDAVAVEYTEFAVIEEEESGHDQESAGGGHDEHTGYAEYAHSDDGYQSDHDQVPSYGVVSGGPSYVQDHDDHSASPSPSHYTPSARGGVEGYPSSATHGSMVDSQSHGGSYSHYPSSRSSGDHYSGNHHGPGTWHHGEHSSSQRDYRPGYYDQGAVPAYRLETQPSYQTHYPPSNAAASHHNAHGGRHMSDYEYLQAWGGRHNFMASYGLKPEPSGYEESQAIMNALRDRESRGYGSSYYSASATAHSPRVHPAAARNEARNYYLRHQGWWW